MNADDPSRPDAGTGRCAHRAQPRRRLLRVRRPGRSAGGRTARHPRVRCGLRLGRRTGAGPGHPPARPGPAGCRRVRPVGREEGRDGRRLRARAALRSPTRSSSPRSPCSATPAAVPTPGRGHALSDRVHAVAVVSGSGQVGAWASVKDFEATDRLAHPARVAPPRRGTADSRGRSPRVTARAEDVAVVRPARDGRARPGRDGGVPDGTAPRSRCSRSRAAAARAASSTTTPLSADRGGSRSRTSRCRSIAGTRRAIPSSRPRHTDELVQPHPRRACSRTGKTADISRSSIASTTSSKPCSPSSANARSAC